MDFSIGLPISLESYFIDHLDFLVIIHFLTIQSNYLISFSLIFPNMFVTSKRSLAY